MVDELLNLFSQFHLFVAPIGETTSENRLQINGLIDLPIDETRKAWEQGLRERLL